MEFRSISLSICWPLSEKASMLWCVKTDNWTGSHQITLSLSAWFIRRTKPHSNTTQYLPRPNIDTKHTAESAGQNSLLALQIDRWLNVGQLCATISRLFLSKCESHLRETHSVGHKINICSKCKYYTHLYIWQMLFVQSDNVNYFINNNVSLEKCK